MNSFKIGFFGSEFNIPPEFLFLFLSKPNCKVKLRNFLQSNIQQFVYTKKCTIHLVNIVKYFMIQKNSTNLFASKLKKTSRTILRSLGVTVIAFIFNSLAIIVKTGIPFVV